jgi:hypothetical protein
LERPSNGRNTKQSRKRGTDTRGMVVGGHTSTEKAHQKINHPGRNINNLDSSLFRYKSQVLAGWSASVAKKSAVSSLGAKCPHIQM